MKLHVFTRATRGLVVLFTSLVITASSVHAQTWVRHTVTRDLTGMTCLAGSSDLTKLVVGSGPATDTSGHSGTGNIYRSADSGVTWLRTSAPSLTNNWSTVISSADGTHLAAIAGAGGDLYVSQDSGTTWLPPRVHLVGNVVGSTDGLKLLALGSCFCASPNPLYHSSDGGLSWTTSMIPGTNTWSLAASSSDGSRLILFGLDIINHTASVYLSTDSGFSWQKLPAPFKNWNALAASADAKHLVLANLLPESLYTSQDYGASWTVLPAAPAAQLWVSLASSADGTHLAAGTADGYGGFYVSTDAGLNWAYANPPQPQVGNKTIKIGWSGIVSSRDGLRLAALADYYADSVFTVALTDIYATMTATPQRLQNGNPLAVVVSVQNSSTNNLTGVKLAGGMVYSGTGGVALTGDFSSGVSLALAPGQTGYFTNLYQATNNGRLTFSATVQATESSVGMVTFTCSSPEVLIVPNGDLLVKRNSDPADAYAGLGVFQKVPIALQVVTNVVGSMTEISQFQVLIENNDPIAQTYTMQARVLGNLVWKEAFVLSGDDQTTPLQAYGGITLPSMDPGTSLILNVSLQDTNAQSSDLSAVGFTLGLASDPTLTLDAVGTVTLLVPEIIVNSTGDSPNQDPNGCCCDTGQLLADGKTHECTLRAALELVNRSAVKNIIRFQIPPDDPGIVNGVPSIRPQTALPDIANSVVIDGWSQSASSGSPPVELSGIDATPQDEPGSVFNELAPIEGGLIWYHPQDLLDSGIPSGLHVAANGCEIRGLVINYFPSCGILVDGSDTIIQRNYLGTDPTGSLSEPNGQFLYAYNPGQHGGGGAQLCLQSPGNLVGGSDGSSGNVISGGANSSISRGWVGTVGLAIMGAAANGNVVEGNILGLDSSATHTPFIPLNLKPIGSLHDRGQFIGVWISDGSGNRVGSSTAGAGNIIAGNHVGVLISGGYASGNVIAGNRIGWSAGYAGDASAQPMGVSVDSSYGRPLQNIVGGVAVGAGNVIGDVQLGIHEAGSSDLIQGNWIGVLPDGKTAIPVPNGIFASVAQAPQLSGNVVANVGGVGIWLQDSPSARIFGNRVLGCGEHGVKLSGNAQGTVVSLNTISGTGQQSGYPGNGIYVAKDIDGSGNVTISQNNIHASAGLGIGFNRFGVPFLNSDGAQPIRILVAHPPPLIGNGQIQITGTLEASAGGGTYLLEFFGNDVANPSGYGEGQTFLGSAAVTVGLLGNGTINATFPSPNNPGVYLTATATGPDGSTTEFSRAVLIEPCVPGIKGICPGLEANVPNLPSGPAPQLLAGGRRHPLGGSSSGDGNGDGIQDSLESNVASLPSLPGLWVTLAGPTGTTLENVTPTGPPDFTTLPAGYVFPIGFLNFGITNLPANGSMILTNFLHLGAATNFSYAATTYFNYGPTPDNTTPHWYQFLFDGTNGAQMFPDRIILHFHDGARGDHDLSVNGEIVTIGAPAYQLPSVPQLVLAPPSVGSSNIVSVLVNTNSNSSLVTNSVPVVTSVLSWPASATNYGLQYVSDLSAQDLLTGLPGPSWQNVPQTPAIVNGRNFVTNTAFGATGFFRLFR